jgi:hypothetical protein
MNVKRPKRINEEDEDDLLQFQEEFLKQKQQPSVKLIKKEKDVTWQNVPKNEPEANERMNIDSDQETRQNILFDIVVSPSPA